MYNRPKRVRRSVVFDSFDSIFTNVHRQVSKRIFGCDFRADRRAFARIWVMVIASGAFGWPDREQGGLLLWGRFGDGERTRRVNAAAKLCGEIEFHGQDACATFWDMGLEMMGL